MTCAALAYVSEAGGDFLGAVEAAARLRWWLRAVDAQDHADVLPTRLWIRDDHDPAGLSPITLFMSTYHD